jgi:predicted ATP-dependent serine protease
VDDGGFDRRGSARSVIGCDTDLEFIGSFLGQAAIDGGALLMSGDAGVGKTLLLELAAMRAAAGGTKVRRAAGTEFEADLSFAGL